ncbi:hypothetical protein J7I98_39230 [Streptomyces sp. ISL-98]|uniref:hypothetical protein n=1 Tax=Streptomyces sp. ISL-98 TaxID=2819192 RepID=UPI001BE89ADB|nr:hypothetical protein [Streptomyces sp. ISL-98]MBT2511709.1 hypothetical protein [Streptomyces sp. ISL-98]
MASPVSRPHTAAAPARHKPRAEIDRVLPGKYKNTIKDLEVRDGANSRHRGIKFVLPVEVWRKGAKTAEGQTLQCVYRFEPDPHVEPKYNKDQEEFYRIAATELAGYVAGHNRLPEPTDGFTVVFGNTTFTLTPMQHPIGRGFKIQTAPDGPRVDG